MASRAPASITGIGLVTPAGIGRAANWAAVCAARPTARVVDTLSEAPVGFASTVPGTFDVDRLTGRRVSRHYDRSTQFALVAARAALNDARITAAVLDEARVAVVVGTAFGGIQAFEDNHARLLAAGPEAVNARFLPKSLVNMVSGILSIELGATGPNMVVSTACASGATAIGIGLGLLRSDGADIVVCGGTDASVTPLHVAGFHKLRALTRARKYPPACASRPFDRDHDGFVMAEGAGILVLERDDDAAARGVRPFAHLAGYGASADAHHITAPHPDGHGAKAAIRAACRDAGLALDEIDHVNAHATSTPTGDTVEAGVIADLMPRAVVTSTKGVTGHTLGAAGTIEAAYAALALRAQTVPPTANLDVPCDRARELDLVASNARTGRFDTAISNSFGFGGHNAVLAFTAA
ncbi:MULTISPECIES: beta-ketoacyl-[acyl-carrier-protein] synthase family protein [Amycolatopsis]|uniref:Beta-ketoacyl-[acyl-carrier-protein] synthase family protein n=1 Tax=Amycolatopsis alkalitolerans TaxID=2547244 RepID=A0A5C4LW86_9PSEU|nr:MULTISPECIES: beta-ketoacyl-[acyl-carrier-protein] synthase family protein [Amycolatopsis]TNC22070.1 beta-ketoacyl-[acyl-carrier-protein] synthase family protein [Amycolatopsis alkalitolerans]